jgi:hypothetical protein
MAEKARIDRGLIANLRERSRPLRPDASLTRPQAAGPGASQGLPPVALLEELLARLERLEERVLRLERPRTAATPAAGHTLFVPSSAGYAVVERSGPPPEPGETLVLDGGAYCATGYRCPPFPADSRPCVVLEPAGGAVRDLA